MRPPRNATARGRRAGSAQQTLDDANRSTPWAVLVDGRRPGMLWGRYASRAGAEATARQLRAHGFVGIRVEGPAT